MLNETEVSNNHRSGFTMLTETREVSPLLAQSSLPSISEEPSNSGHLFEFEICEDAEYIENNFDGSDRAVQNRHIYGTLDPGIGDDGPYVSQGRSRISRVATMLGEFRIIKCFDFNPRFTFRTFSLSPVLTVPAQPDPVAASYPTERCRCCKW